MSDGVDLKMIEMLARTVGVATGCKVTVSVLVTVEGEQAKVVAGIMRRVLGAADISVVTAGEAVGHGSINLN